MGAKQIIQSIVGGDQSNKILFISGTPFDKSTQFEAFFENCGIDNEQYFPKMFEEGLDGKQIE